MSFQRGQCVEIIDFFHGSILNAVDAKGRVSLPSTFRNAIDRRARRAALPGDAVEDRIVMVGEHEEFPCLTAFDQSYSRKLYENIEKRVAAMDGVDEMKALDNEQMDAFGAMNEVSYDGSGRMVLSPLLRSIAGISDCAYFVGAGGTFQIWSPERFREAQADKPRLIRALDHLLAERSAK